MSYCLGLHTRNPGLIQVDLLSEEPSPKRGSDKINVLKQGRNIQKKKAKCIVQSGLTYGSQHIERWTRNPVLSEEPIGPDP